MSTPSPDPIDILVGCRLRTRRRELGLTQDDLATALGVRFQQVQKYETGQNRIAASRLYKAAGALRVSVDWFFNHAPTSVVRATDGRPDCPCNGQCPVGDLTVAELRPTRRTENAQRSH